MKACEQLTADAASGVAAALRAVDCLASETTSSAFGRLFGTSGGLTPALTILLTLYVAFFAFSLLTGRSRIGVSALTPRMLSLGLALTFATSWVAYNTVVWNLAIGAPDQIATTLTGNSGSATRIFADRIDVIFNAIAEVEEPVVQNNAEADANGGVSPAPAPASAQGQRSPASASFTPMNVMWLGALILLIGTVGILVTARIALAVLLAIGPVFIVLGLFTGTRGLTAGWLRSVVLMAIMPLFVVVGGGIVLELLVPIVSKLRAMPGEIDGRAAMALFTASVVHLALMSLIGKATATIVSAWSAFGLGNSAARSDSASAQGGTAARSFQEGRAVGYAMIAPGRIAPAAASFASTATQTGAGAAESVNSRVTRTMVSQITAAHSPASVAGNDQRARGVGSRFRSSATSRPAGIIR